MQINNPLPATLLKLNATPALLQSLKAGDLVLATVIDRITPATIALQIGKQRVHASSSQPHPPGEVLKLKVVREGKKPVLQQIDMDQSKIVVRNETLRQALPRQMPLSPLLANLDRIAEHPETAGKLLPRTVTRVVAEILRHIVDSGKISDPAELKRGIRESGTFMEATLASASRQIPETVARDFKAGLLRLAALLTPTHEDDLPGRRPDIESPPPLRNRAPKATPQVAASLSAIDSPKQAATELARQTESSLARVQLNQLASLPQEEGASRIAWVIELPVRNDRSIDVLHLQIEQKEKSDRDDHHRQWSVDLSFDFEGLGPVYARLSLRDKQIRTRLWAEQPATLRLLEDHIGILRQQFARAELDAIEINLFRGRPAAESSGNSTPDLVDLEV